MQRSTSPAALRVAHVGPYGDVGSQLEPMPHTAAALVLVRLNVVTDWRWRIVSAHSQSQ
jgi:hypothetical protein